MQRWSALDRLRGVALVGMLIHHLTDWMTGDARAVLPGWRSFAVTDVAAVAFFVAAGASMALFVSSRRARGMSRRRVSAQVLRRYGLLVPIGMALDWVLWRHPTMFGVLEALGVAVVVAAAVVAAIPDRLLPAAAAFTVVGGMVAERLATGHGGWWADELLAGKFPIVTYVGFVLVGAAIVRSGRYADERWAMGAAAVGVAATVTLLVAGVAPDRYPGDLAFVIPGLAGTAIVYALAQTEVLGSIDPVIRRAAAHTLGIFVAHYAIYAALRQLGLRGDIPGLVAVPLALGITAVACLLAPRVPQPPWSARTGRRRPRPVPAGVAGTGPQFADVPS
jgi:surface polysaccharide O-acyltransferase-like enzyme